MITVFLEWAADYLQHDFLLQHRLKVKSDQQSRAKWSLNRTYSSFWVVDDFINIFRHIFLDFHSKDFEIEELSQFKSESEQINSILATSKISFSFFIMMNMKMFKFVESKEEDLNIFIIWVEFAFLSYKEKFDTLKTQSAAKTFFVKSNCIKKAKLYISELNVSMKNNFEKLMSSLRERFSEKKKRDKRKKIMNSLFEFKQQEKRLHEYFRKIRYLKQNLKNLKSDIARWMIKDLNDNITRKIVRSTLAIKIKSTVKKIIKVIQNAEEEKFTADIAAATHQDSFQASESEKMFIEIMKQQQMTYQEA